MYVCLCGQCLENFSRHCPHTHTDIVTIQGWPPMLPPPLWTGVVCCFYMDREWAANRGEGGGRAGKDQRVHYVHTSLKLFYLKLLWLFHLMSFQAIFGYSPLCYYKLLYRWLLWTIVSYLTLSYYRLFCLIQLMIFLAILFYVIFCIIIYF